MKGYAWKKMKKFVRQNNVDYCGDFVKCYKKTDLRKVLHVVNNDIREQDDKVQRKEN